MNADELDNLSPEELLAWAMGRFGRRFAVLTSFQDEGMAILDMALRLDPAARVMTIDTGCLPPETHEQMATVRARYGADIEVLTPDAGEIAALAVRHGSTPMYAGIAERMLCCHLRKVRPLDRALEGLDAWAVGLRRGQSESRREARKVDQINGKLKLSPLVEWSRAQLDAYLRDRDVPRHPLYAQGYTSIGCAPCTRAVAPGEPERAGRWWWEADSAKECGLHFTGDGQVRRRLDVLLEEVLQTTYA